MKKEQGVLLPEKLEIGTVSMVLEASREGESDFDACLFEGEEFSAEDLYGLSFTRCRFSRCRFAESELGRCSFVDVRLENCDFSGAALSESFWQRCELSGCRLTGSRWDSARLRQVSLRECAAQYAGFDRARLDRVRLEDCDFQAAYLRLCRLKDLRAERCSFLSVNFYQTPLAGVDFTGCEIGGWTLSEEGGELRGAVVTPVQAVELAARLGLVVKDRAGNEPPEAEARG